MMYGKWIVFGEVTQPPELKYNQKGDPWCLVKIRTSYKQHFGDSKDYVDEAYLDWVLSKKDAEKFVREASVGDALHAEGHFQSRQQQGKNGSYWRLNLRCDKWSWLDRDSTGSPSPPREPQQQQVPF